MQEGPSRGVVFNWDFSYSVNGIVGSVEQARAMSGKSKEVIPVEGLKEWRWIQTTSKQVANMIARSGRMLGSHAQKCAMHINAYQSV